MPNTKAPSRQPSRTAACGARNRAGEPCQRPSGWGTDHFGYGLCKLHGGSSPGGKKQAAKLAAAELPIVMGMELETDPDAAIMRSVYLTAGAVEYCNHMVAFLSTEAELARPVPSEQMQWWLQIRKHSIEDLARFGKMAVDAGVARRQVEIAENMGGLLGGVFKAVFDDLALTPEQRQLAPMVLRRHLELMPGRLVA